MIEQQYAIQNFQSQVFTFFIEQAENLHSIADYLMLIETCCSQHLGIEKCYFMLLDDNHLKGVQTESGLDNLPLTLPYMLIENCFDESICIPMPQFLLAYAPYKQFELVMRLSINDRLVGILLLAPSNGWQEEVPQEDVAEMLSGLLSYVLTITKVKANGDLYEKLYNVADLFHSTMDIDKIIENILSTMEENVPEVAVDLILSNDQDRQTTMKVKPFDYLSERPSTIEAFVSGEVTTEYANDLNIRLMNVPIKGRQGIYGVLQISAPLHFIFSKSQKDFIRLVSTAAGNALENAKLYHQSHRLISDLQLINETTHRLNMNLPINEMLRYLKNQLEKSFQPMETCFVLFRDEEQKVSPESTLLFKKPQGKMYINYAQQHFSQTVDPLFVPDLERVLKTPSKFKSMMAIPILMDEQIGGYALVLHEQPYFFSFDSFKLMQSLIHHSSLAISNSILRNKLQEMVDQDHLTKLYARSYLDKHVEKSLCKDICGMFMLLDIDNFKYINDTYGHQIGDEVLVQIAEKLKRMIGHKGICARWGGEELAVYMANISPQQAMEIANAIVEVIPTITTPSVTISSGLITWHRKDRPEFQTLFLHADKALYVAKNSGKNKVCVFHERMLLNN